MYKYFGKDWKFFWKTSVAWRVLVRIPCTWLGYKLLTLGRKMIRVGYIRCSWCGEEQNRHTGLHMSASKKGMRCCNHNNCSSKPYV